MRMVHSVAAMQRLALRWKRDGRRIVLVPTMGYLHAGHLSLVRRGRRLAGSRGRLVVSIYVNPTQFGPKEDLSRYPRDLKRDVALCRGERADVVFAPADEEMYPGKASRMYSTYIVEEMLSRGMEGASRPGHFRGVATVVSKLFNIVQPDIALFGAKDYQQVAVVTRMTANLNFPVKIVVASTVRESDGLAMSSRNKYLTGELREASTVLWRSLQAARRLVRVEGAMSSVRLKAHVRRIIGREPAARLDYVEFFDSHTLRPVATVTPGTRMALAVFVGNTRLIDNLAI